MSGQENLGIIEMNESELATFIKAMAKTNAQLTAKETGEGLVLVLKFSRAEEDDLVCLAGFIQNYIGDLLEVRGEDHNVVHIFKVYDELQEWD